MENKRQWMATNRQDKIPVQRPVPYKREYHFNSQMTTRRTHSTDKMVDMDDR